MRVCQFRHSRTEQDVFYTRMAGLSRGNFAVLKEIYDQVQHVPVLFCLFF